MDFNFTEEQILLGNLVDSLVRDYYDWDNRMKYVSSEFGMSRENWKKFSELGLLAASFPEALGGLGGTAIDTMIIMQGLGKGLVTEPYLPTIVLCGGILSRHGSSEQKEMHLPSMISGETIWGLGFTEDKGRNDPAYVGTTAQLQNDAYVLSGKKSLVVAAPWADWLIVTARFSGQIRDKEAVGLFIVEKSSRGLSTRDYTLVDGFHASDIDLNHVVVPKASLIGTLDSGFSILDEALDCGIAALCGEAIGNMEKLNEETVEYCKTRRQFGMPIGKFQVLQHYMVDMLIEYEQSVSMTYMVNMKMQEATSERQKAASMAKIKINKAARFIGQKAVQLHGGMGMTKELNVGHYFKRLTVMEQLFGSTDDHLKRCAMLDNI